MKKNFICMFICTIALVLGIAGTTRYSKNMKEVFAIKNKITGESNNNKKGMISNFEVEWQKGYENNTEHNDYFNDIAKTKMEDLL